MRKRNFDIMGKSIIAKLPEKKFISQIYLLILQKFHQLPNLNRKEKNHQVSYNFHINFPSNLFVDKI